MIATTVGMTAPWCSVSILSGENEVTKHANLT